jgi:hypothetical protein
MATIQNFGQLSSLNEEQEEVHSPSSKTVSSLPYSLLYNSPMMMSAEISNENPVSQKENKSMVRVNGNKSKSQNIKVSSSEGELICDTSNLKYTQSLVQNNKQTMEILFDICEANMPSKYLRQFDKLIFRDDTSKLSDLTGLTSAFHENSDGCFVDGNPEDETGTICTRSKFYESLTRVHATDNPYCCSVCLINDNHGLHSAFLGTRKTPICQKQVNFSTVFMQYYKRILTIHPSTTQGPSMGLAWTFQLLPAVSVDEYKLQSFLNPSDNPHPNMTSGPHIFDRQE